jgi:hypothetical protein
MSSSNKKIILANILSCIIGLIFIFSAWTKTYPISEFEYIIYSQVGTSKVVGAYIARIIIGVEFALGFFLIAHGLLKKKLVIISSILLLLALTIHLVILYINVGNDANCGCMGTVLPMKPLPSILKNVILLAILLYIHKHTNGQVKIKLHNGIIVILTIISMVIIYFSFPMRAKPEYLSFHKLYDTLQPMQPSVDLLDGKHIVSFMTLGCGHCRDAARALSNMKREHPEMPFYILFHMPTDSIKKIEYEKDFMDDTKATNIPYSYINDSTFFFFIKESGNIGTPVILWMKDSFIVKEIPNYDYNAEDIINWLKTK